uniref:t-SNARE coiled-coil homology domain-containing protein n=1 Tax=Parastrongyloides trichosuri TaxID=131310 RepID=A0A0N4ZZ95_PARTI
MLSINEAIANFETSTVEAFTRIGVLKDEITICDKAGGNSRDKRKDYKNWLQYILSEYDVLKMHRNNLNYKESLEFDSKIQNITNKINFYKFLNGNNFWDEEIYGCKNPFLEDNCNNESYNGTQLQKDAKMKELMLIAEERKAIAEAHKQLECDVQDLNDIMEDLHKIVHCQGEMVDSIEHNIEQSVTQVQQGHDNLKKAVKAKNKKVPVIAAAVGGVALGGPAGIAIGTGTGIVAAVTGAVVGLFGGKWISNKVTKEATS